MLSIALVRRSSDAVRYYEKDDYYTREAQATARNEGDQHDLLGSARSESGADESINPGAIGGGGAASGKHQSGPDGESSTGTAERATEASTAADSIADEVQKDHAGGRSGGHWYGRAAQALGLEGHVDRDEFKDVLDGHLPNGVVLGRRFEGEWQHTPGWDLTFSAPKSVSILAEVAQDDRLHEAHERAVMEALAWAEENAIGTRVPSTAGTIFERTGSMLVARFTHHTSRNQDPNLHTHAVVANATLTENGDWRSVHSRELFVNKMAIGQVYRASLARDVLELGYQIERTHADGRFEIVGVPKELIKDNSSRRTAVENKLAEWGASDPETAARAALVTRPHKRDVPLSQLIATWRQTTDARGFDVDALVADSKERGPQQMPAGPDRETILRESIQKLAEPEAVFRHGDLVREVLARGVGRLDVKAAENEINLARIGVPLRQADEGGRRLWTTTKASAQEKKSLEIAAGVDRSVRPFLTKDQANEIFEGRGLTDGQRSAAELILTTDSPHTGVVGRPGTGKTTMLRAVREQLERQGVHVIGMAQNANAARNMEKEAGIESSTIHKHLGRIASRLAQAKSSNLFDRLITEFTRRDEVWVIDEASQLDNNLMNRVLRAADTLGARTVFVGDTRQLSAIQAGKPFDLLLDRGMPHVEMNEIVRQRHAADREVVHDAIAGRVNGVLDKIEARTHGIKDKEERFEAVVNHWARDLEKRDSTVVLTVTNKERAAIIERMRDVLRSEGKIRGEMDRIVFDKVWGYRMDARDAAFYNNSHVIRFGDENRVIGAKSGSYWDVIAVDSKRNLLLIQDVEGRQVLWNPREDGARAEHGPVVFERRATTLAPGEKVRWTDNRNEFGLVNGQILTVEKVKADATTFRTDEGRKLEVSHSEDSAKHWQHANAATLYSAQGVTAEHAIVHMNSEAAKLINQRLLVVAVSRQREQVHLYTDSRNRLQAVLERNVGDKSSAVEALERHDQVDAAQRVERELLRQRQESAAVQRAVELNRTQKTSDAERSKGRTPERGQSGSRSRERGRDEQPRPPPVLER